MKMILLFVLCFSTTAFAAESKDCQQHLENKRIEMNVISSNLANVSTTRTPAGGFYQKQTFRCKDLQCETLLDSSSISKFEPGHPDADDEDYVQYPNINLMDEMTAMIQATRDYEEIAIVCKSAPVTN